MKKNYSSFLRNTATLFLTLFSIAAYAQPTTINTTVGTTGYDGSNNSGVNGFITFVLQNNNAYDVTITAVGNWSELAHNGTTSVLWMSTSSLSGPVALAGPVWNSVATNVVSGITATGVNTVIPTMSHTLPAGAIQRFALNTTGTNYYSGGTSTPSTNTLSGGGVTLYTYDYQIAGQAVGYGAGNAGRAFTGYVTFQPAGLPCTGIPSNAIVVGPSEVCPNKQFNLSIGTSTGVGILGLSYQWESSADGLSWGPFTGIVNPTTGTLTDVINAPKWYRCTVKCIASNQSYTTPAKKVSLSPFYYCYCDGSKATTLGFADIGNVTVINHSTGDTLLNNGNALPTYINGAATKSYTKFSGVVAPFPIYPDSNYRVMVSQINKDVLMVPSRMSVYLDYNRNGTFDKYERVVLGSSTPAPPTPGLVTDTFKVIADSFKFGLTGMRVILRAGTEDPDTCASYADGETEDYLVDMRYIPCTGPANAGVIIGDTSMCVGYKYKLYDTTYQKRVYGLSRSWQESGDGINWFEIGPGSYNNDSLTRIFTGQPVYYRVKMLCTITNDSSFSPVFRVNLKPSFKCYCYSRAEMATTDTSDIGSFKMAGFVNDNGGPHLQNVRAWEQRQDFTDLQPMQLRVDSIYDFYVFHSMPLFHHADAKITVFVDFNNNHQYDIPSERIYTGFTSVGNFTRLGQVIIPDSVIVDMPTGMRVILNNNVAPNTQSDEGCGVFPSGETEDYMVLFKRPFTQSVGGLNDMGRINVYPNPTSGKFTVGLSTRSAKEVTIRVTNVTGQQIMAERFDHSGGNFVKDLDLGAASKGIYFVEVEVNGQRTIQKLILN